MKNNSHHIKEVDVVARSVFVKGRFVYSVQCSCHLMYYLLLKGRCGNWSLFHDCQDAPIKVCTKCSHHKVKTRYVLFLNKTLYMLISVPIS